MLKERIITGLVLITLVLGANFLLPSAWFALVLSVFIVIGAWEWARLMRAQDGAAWAGMPFGIALVLLALWLTRETQWIVSAVFTVSVLGWCGAVWWLRHTERLQPLRSHGAFVQFLFVCVLLPPCWLALTHLHALPEHGPAYVFYLIGLIALADTAAYFTGRAFGRRKLAPAISPGKTWEGVAGAVAATSLYGIAGGWMFGLRGGALAAMSVLCVITVLFSIVGDLFESLIKRQAGVKDSGQIFPGHGGVLDRIDSYTAGAPVFAFGMSVLDGL